MSEFDLAFGGLGGAAGPGDPDYDRAVKILGQFNSAMVMMYPGYALSTGDLVDRYDKPAGIIAGIGLGATVADMSDSDTQAAMSALASQGGGQIPANWNYFTGALQNQAVNVSWVQAVPFVVGQSISDITSGVQKVGDVAISTGSAAVQIAKLTPLLLWGLAGLFVYNLFQQRERVGSAMTEGALKLGGAATGGLMNLGAAATSRAIQGITGNPKRRRRRRK